MLDTKLIDKVATDIQVIMGQELIRLKRNASGALINSFRHDVNILNKFDFEISIKGLDYWRVVNYGVPASNVPYDARQRSGAANSKYIDGLINWLKVKGIGSSNDVVKGIAFAIATKQTSTAKGGFGFGNPMDKNKLGFIQKTEQKRNREVEKLAKVYQTEVITLINDRLHSIEITI